MSEKFLETMQQGYVCEGDAIQIGVAMHEQQVFANAPIKLPLKSLSRHGLITGATGTGKTKTIQMLSEQLSLQGIPVLLMDLKGDLSGLAAVGKTSEKITQRLGKMQLDFNPQGFPVEFLTLSTQPGVRLRSTVSEFGPILFAQMLELNDTQSGVLAVLFQYAKENNLPLLDLQDIKKLIQFSQEEGKEKIKQAYGQLSSASLGAILRKIVELESQGANQFFGEPSFAVIDLIKTDNSNKGVINIIRLVDLQQRPKLFSSFMLALLAEIYAKFPELGDVAKPKLVIFIDEAHLLFNEASKNLLNKIEAIIKLIRSKGVGVFFCSQNPTDIDDAVLSQLGLKIQHALRAFTAKDRKAIKLIAENFPLTDFYQTDELLTSLGVGEALVTALNEKAKPTPLAETLLRAPLSRMGTLTENEINSIVGQSPLVAKYAEAKNRESAYELLSKKLENQTTAADALEQSEGKSKQSSSENIITTLSKNTMVRQLGRTVVREVVRGLMSVLGVKKTRRRR